MKEFNLIHKGHITSAVLGLGRDPEQSHLSQLQQELILHHSYWTVDRAIETNVSFFSQVLASKNWLANNICIFRIENRSFLVHLWTFLKFNTVQDTKERTLICVIYYSYDIWKNVYIYQNYVKIYIKIENKLIVKIRFKNHLLQCKSEIRTTTFVQY